MPSKSRQVEAPCPHTELIFESSPNAHKVGYSQPSPTQLFTAATSKRAPAASSTFSPSFDFGVSSTIFPAPLVLPPDDLSYDPKYPLQSLLSWQREKHRNLVTPERGILYVVREPTLDPAGLNIMRGWSSTTLSKTIPAPSAEDLAAYLSAFYHPMPVRVLDPQWYFTSWTDDASAPTGETHVALADPTTNSATRIRTRTLPRSDALHKHLLKLTRRYAHQLSVNDLLDALLAILPRDAYAAVALTTHDIFETADDDFICGRAYGGSRIAVVSAARYHPALDAAAEVEREHGWPASHCAADVQLWCHWPAALAEDTAGRDERPLRAALAAFARAQRRRGRPGNPQLAGLWLARVCRTASHEAGHCFGMDHCGYFACAMQGTASVAEDTRQPLELCPVDLAKVVNAVMPLVSGGGGGREEVLRRVTVERYAALRAFCAGRAGGGLFEANAAWLEAVLGIYEGRDDARREVIVID